MTLLHFVVVELLKVDEKILCLPDELKHIKSASSLKLESIIASIDDVDRGLEITKQEIDFAKTDLSEASPVRSKFLDSLRPFYEDCCVQVLELKELRQQSLTMLRDVSEYFGENGDEPPSRQMDIFRTMHLFLNMFEHVSKDVQDGRTSVKGENRNDKAQRVLKPKDCNGNKECTSSKGEQRKERTQTKSKLKDVDEGKLAALLSWCNVKDGDENSAGVDEMPSVVYCSPDIAESRNSLCKPESDQGEQPMNTCEAQKAKEIEEGNTIPVLIQSPLKANVLIGPQSIGYDSDWSTG